MTTAVQITDPLDKPINERRMRAIAREIALDIHDLDNILKTYRVTPEQWERIRRNRQFDTMLRDAVEHWNSALSTRERVELKAQALIEAQLEGACELMNDKSEPATARVEMFKAVARVGKIGEKDLVSEAGQKVNISINMGSKEVRVEKDITSEGKVIEGELTNG